MKKMKSHYGWVVVFACFLLTVSTMVLYYNTFSYYQVPITTELGISYTQFTLSSACATIGGMLFSLFFANKFASGKTRLYMIIGAAVSSACLFLVGSITQIWHLYILKLVGDFAFSTLSFVSINMLMANWFTEKRSLATAIALTGSNVGGVILSDVVAGWIANQGWRWTARTESVICLVCALVAIMLIRIKPTDLGLLPYDKKSAKQQSNTAVSSTSWNGITKAQAMKTPAMWLLGLVGICAGMCAAGIFTMVPTYLTEKSMNYAGPFAVYSAVGIASRLLVSPLFEKRIVVGSTICSALGVASMVALILCPELPVLAYLSCGLLSFALASGTLAPPLIIGSVFGNREYGGIYGLFNFFYMAGCMLGPIFSSSVRDITGSFQVAWISYIGVFVAFVVFTMLTLRTAPKIRQTYPG